MPYHLLVDLGVRTIGARLRLRSAASQVVRLFHSLKVLFNLSIFAHDICCQFLFQQSGAVVYGEPGDVDDVEVLNFLYFCLFHLSTEQYSPPGYLLK